MRKEEEWIKDYTIVDKVTNSTRESLIHLIEKLVEIKEYRIETLFLAVNLLDSYLNKVKGDKRITCLGSLAVGCLLISAKVEEPITPNFYNMSRLLERLDLVKITKDALIDIESKILRALDFSIHNVISLNFLDRYLRLYGMD